MFIWTVWLQTLCWFTVWLLTTSCRLAVSLQRICCFTVWLPIHYMTADNIIWCIADNIRLIQGLCATSCLYSFRDCVQHHAYIHCLAANNIMIIHCLTADSIMLTHCRQQYADSLSDCRQQYASSLSDYRLQYAYSLSDCRQQQYNNMLIHCLTTDYNMLIHCLTADNNNMFIHCLTDTRWFSCRAFPFVTGANGLKSLESDTRCGNYGAFG